MFDGRLESWSSGRKQEHVMSTQWNYYEGDCRRRLPRFLHHQVIAKVTRIDKPIVHYVVEEMVKAGIKDITMVTRSDKKPLEDYFDQNALLEEELRQAKKLQDLEELKKIHQMANFIYIRQKPALKGIVWQWDPCFECSRSIVGDEPFVFAYGDDLVKMDLPETSFTQQHYEKKVRKNRAVVIRMSKFDETHLYGANQLQEGSAKFVRRDYWETSANSFRLAAFGPLCCRRNLRWYFYKATLEKMGNSGWQMRLKRLIQRGNPVVTQPIQNGRWLTTGDPLHFLEALPENTARDREECGKLMTLFKTHA